MAHRNNVNNNGNGKNNGFVDVDYSTSGAIVPVLNTMLSNAVNQNAATQRTCGGLQTYDAAQPLTVEQAYSQPTEVRYVNARTITKPAVPSIEIPYTEVWKASRLHPQNQWKYFWYPYYTVMTFVSSPVGILITIALIFLGGVNFLLNGSYQGPGYAAGKKIEVIPKELPKFATPVIDTVE
ncbi:hypothetical protein NIES2101_36945 [Calothrix sp. HK-06]|nr:hypothetical protein NIES2101_36945 [Calothrix sp. HK-06]